LAARAGFPVNVQVFIVPAKLTDANLQAITKIAAHRRHAGTQRARLILEALWGKERVA
jgi:hypothetical protein